MKTTIDIPDQSLIDLMRLTRASTKREAVLEAIESYNRRKQMESLAKLAGTFGSFMTQDELLAAREGHVLRNDRH